MQYRELGRTGLRVSQLGFGAMRLPMIGEDDAARVDLEKAIPMIHRAFEGGVNYIDSAVGYCNEDSQRAVGEALKGWRDQVVVSTKNHYYGEDEKTWWEHLENSLERLQVDHIDIYHHHAVNGDRFFNHVQPRVSDWMRKAKEQGLIRHIATSFHDSNDALMRIIETGYPEIITLQYNMLDRRLEEGIALAHEKGIGVVVMGPVGGGRLGVRSQVFASMTPGVARVPELALRFVLANPNISVALSGMSEMQHVEENLAAANDAETLREEDQQAIETHLEKLSRMADLYCTGCRYCLPCPNEVNIPAVFEIYNLGRVYGLWDVARERYQNLMQRGYAADACVECGECEDKCPQSIPIRLQLQEAHDALLGRVS